MTGDIITQAVSIAVLTISIYWRTTKFIEKKEIQYA